MKQFSNDGSSVELEIISGDILFVDPLYFQKIINQKGEARNLAKVDIVTFIKALEERVFPDGGGTLLGYKRAKPEGGTYLFDIRIVQQFDDEDNNLEELSADKEITAFATDSGTLLIMDMANFEKLLDCVTYDDLIEAALEDKLEPYFHRVNTFVGNQGWAFVETPGIGSGFVFKGSGSFILAE